MHLKFRFLLLLLTLSVVGIMTAEAARKNPSYERYIKRYSRIAVEHQRKYGIPASITLAQGLLESGAGESSLARKSNNHFGIKCHSDWKGPTVRHDDDHPGECFRKYKTPEQSFEDHARFLVNRSRYSKLFKLRVRDYKGWAYGLKSCGYATDRNYARRLIDLIEDYELYRYDGIRYVTKQKKSNLPVSKYQIYRTAGLLYVYSNGNDSYETIANSLGFKVKDLWKYNDVPEGYPLDKGDIVYLEKKKKKADKPNYEHVIHAGESMHSISQRYGIQLKSLYKLNKKRSDYVPAKGEVLKLR